MQKKALEPWFLTAKKFQISLFFLVKCMLNSRMNCILENWYAIGGLIWSIDLVNGTVDRYKSVGHVVRTMFYMSKLKWALDSYEVSCDTICSQ